MATQSGGIKSTFAAMAAKNATHPTLSAGTTYDRRRAEKFAPLGEKKTLLKPTLQAFIATVKTMLPPSGLTTLRRNNDKEINAILASPMLVEALMKTSPVEIAGQKLTVKPAAPRSTKIWLYSPSVYIPKERILEALQKLITTTHIEEITDEYGFPTEKLFAYVRGDNIPSAVLVGATRINITYPGMEKKCRLCQSPEHAAGNCPNRKIFNCNTTGHVSAECKAGCRRCGAADHSSRNCGMEARPRIDLDDDAQYPELVPKTKGNETNTRSDETLQGEMTTSDPAVIQTNEISPADEGAMESVEDAVEIDEIIKQAAAALPPAPPGESRRRRPPRKQPRRRRHLLRPALNRVTAWTSQLSKRKARPNP